MPLYRDYVPYEPASYPVRFVLQYEPVSSAGMIAHQVLAQYNDGEQWVNDVDFVIYIPHDDMEEYVLTALTPLAFAYEWKRLIKAHRNTKPRGSGGYDVSNIQSRANVTKRGELIVATINEFVVSEGMTYPIPFQYNGQ